MVNDIKLLHIQWGVINQFNIFMHWANLTFLKFITEILFEFFQCTGICEDYISFLWSLNLLFKEFLSIFVMYLYFIELLKWLISTITIRILLNFQIFFIEIFCSYGPFWLTLIKKMLSKSLSSSHFKVSIESIIVLILFNLEEKYLILRYFCSFFNSLTIDFGIDTG